MGDECCLYNASCRSSYELKAEYVYANGIVSRSDWSQGYRYSWKDRTEYYHTGFHGSVMMTSGESGLMTERYHYDAFGNNYAGSLAGHNTLGYGGKRYDPATGLYDYGFRDYDTRTGRFTTVDPVRDGTNWYAYCNNDPVNFFDLWGLELGHRTTHYRMSDSPWGNDLTGNGIENKKLSQTGCAITEESNAISSATGNDVTPQTINDNKDNFSSGTDDLNMKKVAEDNGLQFDYWTSEVQGNLGNKITEINNSDTKEYVSAQVKYDADGHLHWVGVEDVETRSDGKTYVKIEPSSIHDTEKVNRPRDTWSLDANGNMWIETSDINKIYTYKKSN